MNMVDTPVAARGTVYLPGIFAHPRLPAYNRSLPLIPDLTLLLFLIAESYSRRVGLTRQEERFFFEYLRVAGDRSPLDCARDIAGILGSKTPEEILYFYQDTVDLIFKDKPDLAKGNNRRTHKVLTKFYDTRVVPIRQKQQPSGEVSDKSPNISVKEGTAVKHQLSRHDVLSERKIGNDDVTSQLQAAPFLEILFVPFEEDLANTLASSGCEACPRLKFRHSEKITNIVEQLQNTWDSALVKLGSGGIRLKAPDDGPPAFKACAWGDPTKDQELTLFDLMNALRITSPSTLGYTWEHQPPRTISPQEVLFNNRDKSKRCREEGTKIQDTKKFADANCQTDLQNIDNAVLTAFSPSNPHASADSEPKDQNWDSVRNNNTPVDMINSARHKSQGRRRIDSAQKRKRKSNSHSSIGNAKEKVAIRPEQLLRNAWAQYADVMKQRHDYNLMNGKFPQGNPAVNFPQVPISAQISGSGDREKSLSELIRKDESNLGISFEALKGICSPKGRANVQTPISGKKQTMELGNSVIDELNALSPPSSFKLPPEFHRLSGQSQTPIRSLCGIFDSCQPLSPAKVKAVKSDNPPVEVSQLPEELLNPTMSLLSLLDGMSNSHWVSKLDDDREQGNSLGSRPFAKLFDS